MFAHEPFAASPYVPRDRREHSLRACIKACANKGGGFAVIAHLSRIPILGRQPALRRFALGLLNGVAARRDAKLYDLSPGDVALFCPDMPIEEIDAVLMRIAEMFGLDHALTPTDGREPLFSWFDLSRPDDVAALEGRARAKGTAPDDLPAEPRRPIAARDLARISKIVETQPIADFVKRQWAVTLAGAQVGTLFSETYLCIADLQRVVAPDIDVVAKPALFHFLTRILDRCMLRALTARGPQSAKPISLNLNVGSLFSSDFSRFEEAWQGAPRPVIEIQIVDALTDAEAFAMARDVLKERGYQVLLDGLTPSHLAAIDVGALQADFIKIFWSRLQKDGVSAQAAETLRQCVARVGKERIVLARVEDEEAIKIALGLGIAHFQGHYIDRLMQAMAAKRQL